MFAWCTGWLAAKQELGAPLATTTYVLLSGIVWFNPPSLITANTRRCSAWQQRRGLLAAFQSSFQNYYNFTVIPVLWSHNLYSTWFPFPSVIVTKCLWTCLIWQRSWCLATGCPNWTPTFIPSSTWPSAATARTAAVTTQTRAHLSLLPGFSSLW